MQKRELGNTGLQVSRLGLGGIPFQYISDSETGSIVRTARERGVNLFYTSRMYRDSESRIGRAIRAISGGRDGVVLGSSTHERKRTAARKDIRQSLKNFGTDVIDIYSLHNVLTLDVLKEVMSPGGAYQALDELRSAGFIKFVGISAHQPETILRALELAAFDVVEFPLNFIDREAEESLMAAVKSRGIGFISIKPMAFGYAADAGLAWRYIFSAGEDGAGPNATTVGVYSLDELNQNLDIEANGNGMVSRQDILAAIDVAERKCQKVFCRRCDECVECPQGIDIRTVLRWYEYFDRYHSWDWAREQYRLLKPDLSACDNCGICERECPYHLPIKREFARASIDLLPRRSPRRLVKKKLLGG